MKGRKYAYCLLLSMSAAFLLACEPHYTVKQSQSALENTRIIDSYLIDRQQTFALSKQAHFYIARNINEQNDLVKNRLTTHLHDAFSKYFGTVLLGSSEEGLQDAMSSAKALKTDYLLYPSLQVWNDKTKRWQPYRYSVPQQITIIPPASGSVADNKYERPPLVVKQADLSGTLRVLLRIIDVRSKKPVENIIVTTRLGLIYNENTRPLDFLYQPFSEIARSLSGSTSG